MKFEIAFDRYKQYSKNALLSDLESLDVFRGLGVDRPLGSDNWAAYSDVGTRTGIQIALARAIAREAYERTPIDTGRLRKSLGLTEVSSDSSSIVYYDCPYAVYVHERSDAWHDIGEAKFLENAAVMEIGYFQITTGRRVEWRLEVERGGAFGNPLNLALILKVH